MYFFSGLCMRMHVRVCAFVSLDVSHPTVKVIWRQGHGLKSHPTYWRSRGYRLKYLGTCTRHFTVTASHLCAFFIVLLFFKPISDKTTKIVRTP